LRVGDELAIDGVAHMSFEASTMPIAGSPPPRSGSTFGRCRTT
jgi:hypothetical protein